MKELLLKRDNQEINHLNIKRFQEVYQVQAYKDQNPKE